MQRQNSEVFEELGADLAGVCTAVSGNDLAGEMQVYAVFHLLALPSICGTSCSRVIRYEIFKMSLIQVESCWVIKLGR